MIFLFLTLGNLIISLTQFYLTGLGNETVLLLLLAQSEYLIKILCFEHHFPLQYPLSS